MQELSEIESTAAPVVESGAGEPLAYPPHDGPAGRLIGRRDELDQIADRIDKVVAGEGGIVLIEGEPGIGKTAMLAAAARLASARGLRVLRSEAKELEQCVPFAAIGRLRAVVEEVARPSAEPLRALVGWGPQPTQWRPGMRWRPSRPCLSRPRITVLQDRLR